MASAERLHRFGQELLAVFSVQQKVGLTRRRAGLRPGEKPSLPNSRNKAVANSPHVFLVASEFFLESPILEGGT